MSIHASTQMSIHNLEGALELQKLGFKRVVLARELAINEIEYICQNCNLETEAFIQRAQCIYDSVTKLQFWILYSMTFIASSVA